LIIRFSQYRCRSTKPVLFAFWHSGEFVRIFVRLGRQGVWL
jgi:hypothetical protein